MRRLDEAARSAPFVSIAHRGTWDSAAAAWRFKDEWPTNCENRAWMLCHVR
ncbi:MAG: hypothetical protein AAFN79_14175 [Pseudomonadota bacterium]